MSFAYVVGQITIKNPEKWEEYRRQVPATLAPWDADITFRGKRAAVFAGESRHTDIVVIRFADITEANNWFLSPAYQSLIPLRQQAADVDLVSYET